MTCSYPDLGGASDWLKQIFHSVRPIRSTTKIWMVTSLQYGISALVSQTSFCGETQWWGRKNVGLFLRLWYEKMKVDKTFGRFGWEW